MDGRYIGNHVRAARKLRGLATRSGLSALVDKPRFGPAVIGQIERNERAVAEHEVDWLAQALELPRSYFEDTQPAETTIEDRLDAIEAAITAAREEREQTARSVQQLIQTQNDLLAEQTQLLQDISAARVRGDQAADRIEKATQLADEVVHRLDVAVQRAGQALRAGPPDRKPTAPRRAPKRTPDPTPQDSPPEP